jgi:hypothetical protein
LTRFAETRVLSCPEEKQAYRAAAVGADACKGLSGLCGLQRSLAAAISVGFFQADLLVTLRSPIIDVLVFMSPFRANDLCFV